MDKSTLAIIVPCFNELGMLPQTNERLGALLGGMMRDGIVSGDSYILYVDDGSRDGTWQLIESYAGTHVRGLKLAGNVGHQNALLAGLTVAKEQADVLVSIDADLQDDIHVIPEMLQPRLTTHSEMSQRLLV